MIQVRYGKPGDGMTFQAPAKRTGLRPVSEFSQSKQAARILDYVDRFITYFEQARGYKPECIHLRRRDLAVLGVNPGHRRNGVRLEVMP